jgi:hypothetical protein
LVFSTGFTNNVDASTQQQHESLFSFVQSQLAADPSQSKKFLMALNGIGALVLCFIIDAILFFCRPDLAPHLVSITTILIPAIAGVVMTYLGAQGAVEVKANGVLQKQAQDLAKEITR